MTYTAKDIAALGQIAGMQRDASLAALARIATELEAHMARRLALIDGLRAAQADPSADLLMIGAFTDWTMRETDRLDARLPGIRKRLDTARAMAAKTVGRARALEELAVKALASADRRAIAQADHR